MNSNILVVNYRPYAERKIDEQYHQLLKKILEKGRHVEMTQMGEGAYMLINEKLTFNLANGFPLIGERDIGGNQFKQACGELFGFINGARTQQELEKYGCRWWKPWVSKAKCEKRGLAEGDLGDGSYGVGFHDFPMPNGDPFDQIGNVIQQAREIPHLRTHFISPWIPYYNYRHGDTQQKTVVPPCHGWVHFWIFEDGTLELHHIQRSGDVPVGLVYNIAQYALFAMMIAQILDVQATTLHYTISDAHIYESEADPVRELLHRTPRRFPTVTLDTSVTNIKDFRNEHIFLSDYDPHPKMLIRTPV